MSRTIQMQPAVAAFVANIKKLELDQLENVVTDLEDIGGCDDENEPAILLSDLPRVIPQPLRDHIVALSKEHTRLAREINGILNRLFERSSELYDQELEKEEAKRPTCECCHQKLPRRKAR